MANRRALVALFSVITSDTNWPYYLMRYRFMDGGKRRFTFSDVASMSAPILTRDTHDYTILHWPHLTITMRSSVHTIGRRQTQGYAPLLKEKHVKLIYCLKQSVQGKENRVHYLTLITFLSERNSVWESHRRNFYISKIKISRVMLNIFDINGYKYCSRLYSI